MSQDQPPSLVPSQDRLQEIRDADASIGDMRWFTSVYTHRRELLALIDVLVSDRQNDALAVAALSGMLEPYSGGTSDLHDLVARMHRAREIRAAVVANVQQPEAAPTCWYCVRIRAAGHACECGAPPEMPEGFEDEKYWP